MRLAILMLTVFGLGRIRPAPGTWGSLPPVALAIALVAIGLEPWMIDVSLALFGLVFAIACLRFGVEAERVFARKDPPDVVADEVAGQTIALLFLPWNLAGDADAWTGNLVMAAIAFVAFRVFDITKPPPIRGLQRYRGGWGILVDDLLAGVLAAAVVQVVARVVL